MKSDIKKVHLEKKTHSDFLELVGKRVQIIGSHPWKGETGIVTSRESTAVGFGWRVQMDNGLCCYVFHSELLNQI